MLDIATIDVSVLGEYLERGCISGQLIVSIVEVWLASLVQCLHRVDLPTNFIFDHRIDLVEKAWFVAGAFA